MYPGTVSDYKVYLERRTLLMLMTNSLCLSSVALCSAREMSEIGVTALSDVLYSYGLICSLKPFFSGSAETGAETAREKKIYGSEKGITFFSLLADKNDNALTPCYLSHVNYRVISHFRNSTSFVTKESYILLNSFL